MGPNIIQLLCSINVVSPFTPILCAHVQGAGSVSLQ
jgi:hypothetical protein